MQKWPQFCSVSKHRAFVISLSLCLGLHAPQTHLLLWRQVCDWKCLWVNSCQPSRHPRAHIPCPLSQAHSNFLGVVWGGEAPPPRQEAGHPLECGSCQSKDSAQAFLLSSLEINFAWLWGLVSWCSGLVTQTSGDPVTFLHESGERGLLSRV